MPNTARAPANRIAAPSPARAWLHDAAWALAAAALVLMLAWLGLPPADDASLAAPPAARPDAGIAPAAKTPHSDSLAARPHEKPPRVMHALAGPASTGLIAASANEVEVCGYGRVALPSDDPNPLQRMPAGLRQAALAQAESRMLAHGEPAVRAAALLIGAQAPGGRSRIQQLARLAVGSQDPVVYGLALHACKSWNRAETGSCSLLSNAQWARLEPDNLQPWLELAAEAAAQDDEQAEDHAMNQAARASRSDEHASLLPALVTQALGQAPAMPPSAAEVPAPALQRALALNLARGIQDGWLLTRSHHADSYCSAEAVAANSARQNTCNAVAATLASRGSSLADLASAAAIGRQLGWPEARLLPLMQEQQAMVQLAESAGESAASALDFSCERLARHTAWSREIGRGGELQALRVRLQQQPVRAAPALKPAVGELNEPR